MCDIICAIPDTCGNLPVRTGLCVTSCGKTTAAAAPLWRLPMRLPCGYSKSPVITRDLWNRAKTELESRYSQSECLPLCMRLLKTFEQLSEKKYVSDLLEFIRESQPEDFYQSGQGTVTVSAIHKAKGKEFDWVFLLLNQMRTEKDEDRRRLYVGITRARNELYVHYNSSCLDDITAEGLERETDDTEYPAPEEIISRLSHEDVVLDFFQGKQRRMLTYHSGMFLGVSAFGVYDGNEQVVRFSKKYLAKIAGLHAAGYLFSKKQITQPVIMI